MATFIQFYNRKLDGTLGEALGSDGCQRVDGRLSLHSAAQEAYSRAYQLRHVQRYEAFAILKGPTLREARPYTKPTILPDYRSLIGS